MKRATMIAGAVASFAFFAPLQADAARCKQGSIYRPSIGVCVSKASAQRAGIYRPRIAKASIRHRGKRTRAPIVRKVELARAHPEQPPIVRPARILPEIPELTPDERLRLQLHVWLGPEGSDRRRQLEETTP
ncbi:MAG: hypothetical protein K2Y29_17985 [Beijerinckiaceae bacterium]|nr:hypothetical protein [Beijerinckiaceae bacterium]